MNSVGWTYAVTAVVCFAFGLVVDWGYARIRGRKVLIPYVARSARNVTVAAVMLMAVTVSSAIQMGVNERADALCNREFRTALDYNTAITADQRDLDIRTEELNAARHAVIDNVFVKLGEGVDPASFKALVVQYNTDTARINTEIKHLAVERENLDKNRKPYPEPTCGTA